MTHMIRDVPQVPADPSRLSDADLARWCEIMAHRHRNGGLDGTCRILKEAAKRINSRDTAVS